VLLDLFATVSDKENAPRDRHLAEGCQLLEHRPVFADFYVFL
jgi:hypothetical protein